MLPGNGNIISIKCLFKNAKSFKFSVMMHHTVIIINILLIAMMNIRTMARSMPQDNDDNEDDYKLLKRLTGKVDDLLKKVMSKAWDDLQEERRICESGVGEMAAHFWKAQANLTRDLHRERGSS